MPASAADALRARAAELLPIVEEMSGLPAREPLRIGVRSQADLEAFLTGELAEQFAGDRIRNLMRVYARLGLVPDELDVEPLLQRLLLEQVVGFYDPASDTLFVVDGVSPELVDAVLVHEMVHLLERHHNDRFTSYMNKFMPQWRFYRQELNSAPLGHVNWDY